MTHVVTEACVRCKYTDCVEVCPVDAFREGQNFLAIDPNECIDCTLCVAQCPVGAISIDNDVPSQWAEWIGLNARLSRLWPMITKRKSPPADHLAWAARREKRDELSELPGSL